MFASLRLTGLALRVCAGLCLMSEPAMSTRFLTRLSPNCECEGRGLDLCDHRVCARNFMRLSMLSLRELQCAGDPERRISPYCAQFEPHSGHKDVLIVV